MQIDATSPIKMPPPYGGLPPVICRKPIDTNGHMEYTIQLTGVIEKTSQFLEVFDVLGNANQGDEVRIVIDTPGGNVFATQLLVDYMTRCRATVTTVASGLVASAGTIVWFYGNKREVGPWAKFMYHGTSHGAMGRSSEIKEEATELVKFMENWLKDMVAAGVLSTEEFEKITSCKQDTYITGEAMRKRLIAVLNATEALHVLNEDGEGSGSGEGSGEGEEGAGEGEGSGSGKGEGSGSASNKKKSEGSVKAEKVPVTERALARVKDPAKETVRVKEKKILKPKNVRKLKAMMVKEKKPDLVKEKEPDLVTEKVKALETTMMRNGPLIVISPRNNKHKELSCGFRLNKVYPR